jgi:putative membrane protein
VHAPGNPEVAAAPPDVDASRRTYLASERTQLAWWRTGLTSIAVALAIGKVVPDLSDSTTRWPYALVGVAYALYGVALFAYGSWRARTVAIALRAGRFEAAPDQFLGALSVAGVGLGIVTAVLVAVD